MATTTLRRGDTAAATSERQALRDLHVELASILAEIARLEADYEASWDPWLASGPAVKAIEKEIADACPRVALPPERFFGMPPRGGIPIVWGDPPPAPPELAEKLAFATAELERLTCTRKAIEAQLADLNGQRNRLLAHVKKASIALLRTSPAAARVVETAERSQRDATDASLALTFCVSQGIIDTSAGNAMTPAAIALARWEAARMNWHDLTYQVAGGRPFKDALDALLADPDAPLPE